MANSFSTQGSTAGNPQAGLLGNISSMNNYFGLSPSAFPKPLSSTSTGAPNGQMSVAPKPGFATSFLSGAPQSTPGVLKPTAPTTALKSTTLPDGTTQTYHDPAVPDAETLAANTAKNNANNYGSTPSPNPTNFQSNLGSTVNSGNQTQNEQSTQAGLLASGQATPLEQTYIDQVMEAKKMQNAGALGTNADASLYTTDTPEQLYDNTVAAPDLAGRAGADNSLYGTFGNIYGDAATAGLAAANTIANRGEAAAQGAYSGAQNQATRATGANEAVTGLTAPQQTSPTSAEYAPGSNQYLQNSGAPAGANGLAAVGALGVQQNQGGTVQEQTGNQAQAQALTSQLASTIQQSGFNSINGGITTQALNGIGQWIQNQSGDPQYQNAYNLINEIASKYSNILNASGGTPTDVSTTSHNIINKLASGQSIQQVIGDLDKNATQSISALKSASGTNAVSNAGTVNAGGFGFTQVNGKWVPA